jgi:hypothetical protein
MVVYESTYWKARYTLRVIRETTLEPSGNTVQRITVFVLSASVLESLEINGGLEPIDW